MIRAPELELGVPRFPGTPHISPPWERRAPARPPGACCSSSAQPTILHGFGGFRLAVSSAGAARGADRISSGSPLGFDGGFIRFHDAPDKPRFGAWADPHPLPNDFSFDGSLRVAFGDRGAFTLRLGLVVPVFVLWILRGLADRQGSGKQDDHQWKQRYAFDVCFHAFQPSQFDVVFLSEIVFRVRYSDTQRMRLTLGALSGIPGLIETRIWRISFPYK